MTEGDDAMKVCVAFATKGRPTLLRRSIAALAGQTLRPGAIVVACTGAADVAGLPDVAGAVVVETAPGLARQRNAALLHAPADSDVIVFFDDDFVADTRWLEHVAAAFAAHSDIACITGNVIADGINGPGLSVEQALTLLQTCPTGGLDWIEDGYSPYGCNMAFRRSAIADLRFDERLVLYGWQEDRDFGAMVARRGGRIVRLGAALGVHLGAKAGRTAGKRLGYSQVVNPVYLMNKGTMAAANAANHILRNLSANIVRSLFPEPYVDRRGRLAGNLLAFRDLATGTIAPERAESI